MGLFKFFGLEEKEEEVEEEVVEKGNVFCVGCEHYTYSCWYHLRRFIVNHLCNAVSKPVVHPKTYLYDEYITSESEYAQCADRNQDNNCTLFKQKRKPITKKRGK
jgi:hypothetical protein